MEPIAARSGAPDGFHRIRHYGFLASAGRACPGVASRARLSCRRGRRSAAGSASAMPLLRRSYGHHRDLPARGSSARAAGIAACLRDHCSVTRRDQPQPTVEVMRLRPVVRHAPASFTSSTTAVRTSRSRCLPPSQHVHHALAQRNYHRVPRVKGIPKSPRHINSRTRILKSP